MRSAAKNHVQLRLCRQTKCPTHIRLKAYLLKCLEASRQPWVRLRFDVIAESFGVTDRTLRRAKRRLEQDPDLKFRTLSKGKGSGWQVIVGQSAKLLWDKEPLFYKRWRDGMRSRNVKDRHCGHLLEGGLIRTGVRLPPPPPLFIGGKSTSSRSRSRECGTYQLLLQPENFAADSKSASSDRASVSESRCCRQREGFEPSLPPQAPDTHKPPACHAGEIERLPSKENVVQRTEMAITTSSSISGAALAKTSMVEQLTLNQLSEGSDQAVVTSENDDCVVPTYEYVCEKCDQRDSNPQSSQNELRDLNSSLPVIRQQPTPPPPRPPSAPGWRATPSGKCTAVTPPDPQSGVLASQAPRGRCTSPQTQPAKENNDTPANIEGRNLTGDSHQAVLTDTLHYTERRTSSSKNKKPALRDRIFACSGPELRRWATGKQLRLAYFEARSAIAWHIWDNCKVKAQPELLKSLWLAGLLAGYTPKQVEKAFAKALTVSHGLATDIGLLENNHRLQFEMSHTVAEAKRILTGVEPENMYYTNKGC
jgi:hypothetical protein